MSKIWIKILRACALFVFFWNYCTKWIMDFSAEVMQWYSFTYLQAIIQLLANKLSVQVAECGDSKKGNVVRWEFPMLPSGTDDSFPMWQEDCRAARLLWQKQVLGQSSLGVPQPDKAKEDLFRMFPAKYCFYWWNDEPWAKGLLQQPRREGTWYKSKSLKRNHWERTSDRR